MRGIMAFNIDTLLTEKLEITPCGALGAYIGMCSDSMVGVAGGLIVGNALSKPIGDLFLQLWNGFVGYRVQFWADKYFKK